MKARIVGILMLIVAYFIIDKLDGFFIGFIAGMLGAFGVFFIIQGKFKADKPKNKN